MVSESRIKSPRIVQPGGGARWFGVFFLGALLGVVAWFGFDYGREWAGLSASDNSRSARRLRKAVTELEQERDSVRQQLTNLQRSSQIDREATRMAQLELTGLQEERQELEKEVEFLRNLVEDGATGMLRIKDFRLSASDQERVYNYQFTVSQSKEDFGWTRGGVYLTISGTGRSGSETLDLPQVDPDGVKNHKIKFRHFQNIKGSIRLPEGFAPDGVFVEIKPTVKKLAPLTESFDWVVAG